MCVQIVMNSSWPPLRCKIVILLSISLNIERSVRIQFEVSRLGLHYITFFLALLGVCHTLMTILDLE